jgi:hypothetical protein
MHFLYHSLIAIVIFGAGIVLTLSSDDPANVDRHYFLAGALGAEAWLAIAAVYLRDKELPRFDMVVASESIIAFGIFALICGVVIAAVFTLPRIDLARGFSLEALRLLLTPFAEGLIAAGFAPLLATVLRHIEVLKYGAATDDAVAPEVEMKVELENLRKEALAATKSFNDLIAACERSRAIFERSATSLNKSTDAYEAGVEKIQAALGRFGEVIKEECSTIETSLGTLNARLEDNENQLSRSTQEMIDLTEATRRFKAAAEEGTTLVEGLRSVVESIERFIHPDR